MQAPTTLTKHATGGLRELVTVTSSFTLILVFTSLMGFVDRVILARYSLHSLEACASAVSLSSIFQMFCLRIAYTTQVFIAQHQGSNRREFMGGCIWQTIWFSFLSMGITIPLAWIIGPRFFQGTSVAESGLTYFQVLMLGNFLFPLGAALSSFYLGRGKTKIVLFATFASHLLNILLDLLLIFGIEGVLLPMGVFGAALGLVIAQLALCLFLFADFFKRKNRQVYGTGQWRLNWRALGQFLKIGIPRSGSSLIILGAWAASTHVMMCKGGDYMIVVAFSSSIFLLINSLINGLTQGIMTASAYVIGAKFWPLLWKIYKSGGLLTIMGAILLAIPCIFFPEMFITAFFKEEITPSLRELLKGSCLGLWAVFLLQGFAAVGNGMLIACRDTMFHMVFHLTVGWMVLYFPIYLFIEKLGWSPNMFFTCTAFFCLVNGIVYYFRLRQEKWKGIKLTYVPEG